MRAPRSTKALAVEEQRFGSKKVLLTPSCTASLEMAALLIDLQPGDEVIMPSYTFVSTDVHGVRAHIDKHNAGAAQHKGVGGRDKGVARHNHFIAGLQID